MKIIACFCPATVFVLTVMLCPLVNGADERGADHQALRTLRDRAAAAINNQDTTVLAACLAKEFVFTTIDQTALTNRSQVVAFYEQMFRGPNAIIASMKCEPKADILTRFLSDSVGYCYGTSVETYTLKNGDVSLWTNRWTALVVKENGEWKAAALHAGANFMENPLLSRVKSAGKRLAALTFIGGALAGVLIGGILMRFKR